MKYKAIGFCPVLWRCSQTKTCPCRFLLNCKVSVSVPPLTQTRDPAQSIARNQSSARKLFLFFVASRDLDEPSGLSLIHTVKAPRLLRYHLPEMPAVLCRDVCLRTTSASMLTLPATGKPAHFQVLCCTTLTLRVIFNGTVCPVSERHRQNRTRPLSSLPGEKGTC